VSLKEPASFWVEHQSDFKRKSDFKHKLLWLRPCQNSSRRKIEVFVAYIWSDTGETQDYF